MHEERTHQNFLRDLVYALRELGSKAARNSRATRSPFDEGREFAYREILARMQNQAEVFGLDKEALCLAGFEPLTGELDPPAPRPLKEK